MYDRAGDQEQDTSWRNDADRIIWQACVRILQTGQLGLPGRSGRQGDNDLISDSTTDALLRSLPELPSRLTKPTVAFTDATDLN